MSLRPQVLTITALLGLMAVFCDVASIAAEPPSPPLKKVFRFRLPFEPQTLDWNQGDVPIAVVQNAMRGLYKVDSEGRVIPDLLEKAKTDKTGTRWTFTIKSGIKWSDGVSLEAQHVVDGLIRLLDPATASSYAYFLFDVENAKEFNKGKTKDHGLVGIKKLNATTLEIKLNQPVSYLTAILTHWVTFPIRSDVLSRYPEAWRTPSRIPVLGAFQINEYSRQSMIVMTPNPFAEKKPWLERVEALIIPEDETAINLYLSGKLEFMTDPGVVPPSSIPIQSKPSPITYFLGIGPGHPLTSTRAGVLALSAALSRDEIPLALGAPHRPAIEYCPPEIWKASDSLKTLHTVLINPMKANPEQARKFLAEAGFVSPEKVPPLTLKYFNRPAIRELAEWLQEQWKKNLGLRVALDGQDPKGYWSELARNPAPLFLNSKGASYPDADAFFRLFEDGGEQNLGRWSNKEYTSLIVKARTVARPDDRKLLYGKAEHILLQDAPGLIPLYFRSTQYIVKPFVRNLSINPLTSVYFDEIHYAQ